MHQRVDGPIRDPIRRRDGGCVTNLERTSCLLRESRNVVGTYCFHLASIGIPTRGFNAVAMTCIEDDNEVVLNYPLVIEQMTSECSYDVVSSGRLIQ